MLSLTEGTYLLPFLLLAIYYLFNRPKLNLPPGPWNIPFVSGIYTVGDHAHVTFYEWAKKYGPLVRTSLGFQDTLIIDDANIMREAFNDQAFNGRPQTLGADVISRGRHGIVFADGEEWAEQRRLVVRTLRDFGFGKQTMEGFIMEEVTEFLKWMKENEGIPVEMSRRFSLATVSSLWTLVSGKRLAHDDKLIGELIDKATAGLNGIFEVGGIVTLFPIVVSILPKSLLKNWYTSVKNLKSFFKTVSETVDAHVENRVDDNCPRDLIDVYLKEVDQCTDQNSSFYKDKGRVSLEVVIVNLYMAGQSTTSSLLTWTVLYMVRFPESQEKLQRELDAIVGRNRCPSITDRTNLPYTEALTREIMRFASIVPFGVPHETTRDAKLGGYDIRKGTVVLPNLWSMNNNEAVWGDPQNFRPERFLSADDKTTLKIKDYINFGTGKRQCAGEALGRDNFFLFLTCMFQRFNILPDPQNPVPSLEGTAGVLRDPQKFKVVIKERN